MTLVQGVVCTSVLASVVDLALPMISLRRKRPSFLDVLGVSHQPTSKGGCALLESFPESLVVSVVLSFLGVTARFSFGVSLLSSGDKY
jgi:hypothetical protein